MTSHASMPISLPASTKTKAFVGRRHTQEEGRGIRDQILELLGESTYLGQIELLHEESLAFKVGSKRSLNRIEELEELVKTSKET